MKLQLHLFSLDGEGVKDISGGKLELPITWFPNWSLGTSAKRILSP
jgi:hypothetical protein